MSEAIIFTLIAAHETAQSTYAFYSWIQNLIWREEKPIRGK